MQKNSVNKIAALGLYTAFCAVIGLSMAPVPNIELLTLFVFFGGYLFGNFNGALVGFIAMFIFSAMNPWGSGLAFPALIVSQVIAYSIIGFAGSIVKTIEDKAISRIIQMVFYAFFGGVLTIMYHFLLTLFTAELAGFDIRQFSIVLLGGLGFSLVQIISNTILFPMLIPVLSRVSKKIPLFKGAL